jgi:hypothetical protein
MISFLGKIQLPQSLLEDVQNREPDRTASYLAGSSFQKTLEGLEQYPVKFPVENYSYYDFDHCLIHEYCQDWYKDLIPESFLKEHNFEKPKNALVLRVLPGCLTVPHLDWYPNLVKNNPGLTVKTIHRLWIPLEDSVFGQALFVGDQVLHKYKAGEVYTFPHDEFHSAANAGLDPRYTFVVYINKKNTTAQT